MDGRRPAQAGAQNPAYRPARPPPPIADLCQLSGESSSGPVGALRGREGAVQGSRARSRPPRPRRFASLRDRRSGDPGPTSRSTGVGSVAARGTADVPHPAVQAAEPARQGGNRRQARRRRRRAGTRSPAQDASCSRSSRLSVSGVSAGSARSVMRTSTPNCWRGDLDWRIALGSGRFAMTGPEELRRSVLQWFTLPAFATATRSIPAAPHRDGQNHQLTHGLDAAVTMIRNI
jgi:hypothetical protein